ncbi:GTPase Era [Clostridia bacterium]|nr:GTPase Era [Clostridia bacterium]
MVINTVFVTIIGRTNAGKSSMLNALIGEKIAAVTPKPQTTRTKITGILTKDDTQFVFIDTPGFHKATTKLGKSMLKSINDSLSGVDLVLYVFDVTRKIALEDIVNITKPVILILNKIDLIEKGKLLPIMEEFAKLHNFKTILPISVVCNDGLADVLDECEKFAKETPLYFPREKFTDQSENMLIAEIIREKLMYALDDEVPHGVAVSVESAKEIKDVFHIDAIIYCERETHKGIIIGKNGQMLKTVCTKARIDLETFFNIQVNLKCWVKVKENWRNNDGILHNLGL